MPVYNYKAMTSERKTVSGSMFAQNEGHLIDQLQDQKLFCLSYEVKEEVVRDSFATKFSVKELSIFARQMSVMLDSGVTIVKALYVMYERAEKKKLKKIYLELYENVQEGMTLSRAMEVGSCEFPLMFVSMVSAGEASGTLVNAMERMSVQYEKDNKLRNTVKNAMIYPIILAVVSIAVVILLMTFVLPTFFSIFEGAELPMLTKIMMAISNSMVNYWYVYAIVIGAAVIGCRLLWTRPKVRFEVDRLSLRAPIFGKYNRTVCTARCARAISSLYTSGIPIVKTLDIVAKLIGNSYVTKKFDDITDSVRQGGQIAASFERTGVFDPMFYSMLSVGEISGSIDSTLEKTAQYYDEEIDTATKTLVTMLEPIMISFLAVIICLILLSVFPAMYSMYNSIG